MQIEVVRKGGFAGMRLRGTVDTKELPAHVAGAAESAVQGLQFDRPPVPPSHPDAFQYEITVDDAGGKRSAVLDEAELPEALRPVVEAAVARGSIE